MIPHAKMVILATSKLEEDEILEKYTHDNNVIFWQGDPEDVISRYIGACENYGVDTIVRVTADCCLISPEIAKLLIKSHFINGADFTNVPLRNDMLDVLCAAAEGVIPVTGRNTKETLGCS